MRPHILVVEDDRYFAGILRDYLEYVGYEVSVAHDGEEGLSAFSGQSPDVVVTDVLLPRRNGLELSALVKAKAPTVPVLLMSAVYKDADAIDSNLKQCGADDYIIKPFSMPELRDKLSALRQGEGAGPASDSNLAVMRYQPRLDLPRDGEVTAGFLPELMLSIRAGSHTGVLALRDESRWKDIVFLKGRPVWADGGDHADRLGTMLLEQGTLDRPQFEAAVAAMSERNIDFGSALTELGFLTATDLYTQLRALVLRRVVLAFGWGVGEWSLGSVFPRQSSSFEVAPLAAIFRGLLTSGDRAAIGAEMAQHNAHYAIPSRRFPIDWGELRGDPDVSGLGPFLSGTRTLAQLRAFEVVEPQVLDVVLWVLFRAGALGFGETPAPEAVPEESIVLQPGLGADPTIIQVAERVIRDYLKHWQKDYFAIYGLTQDADDAAVDVALQHDVLGWQASSLPEGLPTDLRSKAKALEAWVDQAHDTLDDMSQRTGYRARLDEGLTGFYRKVDAPGVAEAAMFFQLGKGFIRSRNFLEAERAFLHTCERVPKSGEYLAYLGYAMYRRCGATRDAADTAEAKLREALDLDPHSAMAWFFQGVIARDQKNYSAAERAFSNSVKYDPGFEPASRALAQVQDLLAGTGGPLRKS
ncbi:MAG: response regulator [Deltaproteobacteria bacterium]|nr:response regulator [Deltaproteobacteria bacterium]